MQLLQRNIRKLQRNFRFRLWHVAGAGEKRVYTTTVEPLFSRSVARPQGGRAKKTMVYTLFWGKTREKGIHNRSGKKGIHHRASDPEKEKKGGLHGGGVYFFLPWGGGGLEGWGLGLAESKEWSASRKEIRTRSERETNLHTLRRLRNKTGEAFQDTLGFLYWSARRPETPQKQDTRPKNEISMNLGNKFLPPLTWTKSLQRRIIRGRSWDWSACVFGVRWFLRSQQQTSQTTKMFSLLSNDGSLSCAPLCGGGPPVKIHSFPANLRKNPWISVNLR